MFHDMKIRKEDVSMDVRVYIGSRDDGVRTDGSLGREE